MNAISAQGSHSSIVIPSQEGFSAAGHVSLPLNQVVNSTLRMVTTSASAVQGIPLSTLSAYKTEKKSSGTEEIPYDEGMVLYHQIKQRHNQLFRDLADL
jgi:hypothetical protein